MRKSLKLQNELIINEISHDEQHIHSNTINRPKYRNKQKPAKLIMDNIR
jgi:hypothetical protein